MTPDSAAADVDVAQLYDGVNCARTAFARAASAVGVLEWVQIVAGEPVRFRFAGNALVDHLTPALEHHPVVDSSTEPLLTIHAWDAASTGAPVPELPGPEAGPMRTRSIVGRARCASSSGEHAQFVAIDREARDAWFAVRSPDDLTHGERGAPFRLVFHWWGAPRGRVLAHAGAVGTDGAGVLLVGPGGAGKSSTALSCAQAGFDYAADDYCLVTAEPSPTAFGLYASGKVVRADLPLYPGLRDAVVPLAHATDDKVLVIVSRACGAHVATSLRLCAVVVPTLTPAVAGSSASRTSARRALQALAPSTVGQLAGGAASTLHALAALTRALPCYELAIGSDRSAVPDAVGRVIDEARPT
jgi:hypothetical protein